MKNNNFSGANRKKYAEPIGKSTDLSAAKLRERSEQCRVLISVREPPLHSITERSMESIFLSNSGIHQRGDSVSESKWVSRSNTELRNGSFPAKNQDLHTNMGPIHRCSRVSRERMLIRHSWVNSAQVELGPDSVVSSPPLSFIFIFSFFFFLFFCFSFFVIMKLITLEKWLLYGSRSANKPLRLIIQSH